MSINAIHKMDDRALTRRKKQMGLLVMDRLITSRLLAWAYIKNGKEGDRKYIKNAFTKMMTFILQNPGSPFSKETGIEGSARMYVLQTLDLAFRMKLEGKSFPYITGSACPLSTRLLIEAQADLKEIKDTRVNWAQVAQFDQSDVFYLINCHKKLVENGILKTDKGAVQGAQSVQGNREISGEMMRRYLEEHEHNLKNYGIHKADYYQEDTEKFSLSMSSDCDLESLTKHFATVRYLRHFPEKATSVNNLDELWELNAKLLPPHTKKLKVVKEPKSIVWIISSLLNDMLNDNNDELSNSELCKRDISKQTAHQLKDYYRVDPDTIYRNIGSFDSLLKAILPKAE